MMTMSGLKREGGEHFVAVAGLDDVDAFDPEQFCRGCARVVVVLDQKNLKPAAARLLLPRRTPGGDWICGKLTRKVEPRPSGLATACTLPR